MPDEVKKRKLTKRDYLHAKEYTFDILKEREGSKFRKEHTEIWKEVDRQVAMQPPKAIKRSGNPDEDWHNAVQLGLLADALEILSADALRLTFPGDRSWYSPHVHLAPEIDENGEEVTDRQMQRMADGVLRSLMSQQHSDFGFRDRTKLSVKESLKHGSMVVEVMWDSMAKFHGGSGVEQLAAPVWQPHSMWNCFPDHSAHVIGTDLIYRGSMIIKSTLPYDVVKKMKNWVNVDQIKKPKGSTPVDIVTLHGDLVLPRSSGPDMYLPNRKTIFADNQFVFSQINDTAYCPLIYTGYERDDVRDPYYSSPLIKRAPTAKMATSSANKFLDSVDLKTEPPLVYEQHDTFFASNGGPDISPGAKSPTTGAANIKLIETGDPMVALQGLQYAINEVEKGTGSNAVRQGVSSGTEQTATEVVKAEQRGELRTVDFVGVLERQALRPFLYMQHDLNLKKLTDYPIFNDEIHTPDFLILSKGDLGKREAHFEIVGSRQLLGEEQRVARFRDMAAFVLSSEMLSSKSDVDAILKQGWDDAKVKEPERFLLNSDPSMEEKLMEIQQQFQQQLQPLQEELQKFQLMNEKHAAEKEQLQVQIQRERTDANTYRETNRILMETRQAEDRLRGLKEQVVKAQQDFQAMQQEQPESEGSAALESSITELAKTIADIEESRQQRVSEIMQEVEKLSPDTAQRLQ
jgi:hypothetical protein